MLGPETISVARSSENLLKSPASHPSSNPAMTSFISASGSLSLGIWLLLPLAIGAMWWPMIGGVMVLILALSCWFRWFGIREMKQGFLLGTFTEFHWVPVWRAMNAINSGAGLAVAAGVIFIDGETNFAQESKAYLVTIEMIWFMLLVIELVVASRMIASVAAWMESTWVHVTQTIVLCLIVFSIALRVMLLWMPQDPQESGMSTLIRAAVILIAAASGVISIWWLADGVNRMSLALADEVSEKSPTSM